MKVTSVYPTRTFKLILEFDYNEYRVLDIREFLDGAQVYWLKSEPMLIYSCLLKWILLRVPLRGTMGLILIHLSCTKK